MEHGCIYMMFMLLFTMTVICFGVDLKAADQNSKLEQNTTSKSANLIEKTRVPKEVSVYQNKKGDDQVTASDKTNNVIGTNDLNKELQSKEPPKAGSDKDHTSEKSHVKEVNGKQAASGGSEAKVVPKGLTTEGNPDSLKPPRKEIARGDECDSSSKCTDDKHKLIACLRVPGNDSPELSLLIQNKGTSSQSISISSPDYIRLEENSVQLPGNENKKVKVSIGKVAKNAFIVLTTEGSNCSIDISDLILPGSEKKANSTTKSSLLNLVSKAPFVSIPILALILVALVCVCIRFRRKNLTSNGSKYQPLETELPLSNTDKKETDVENGWEDSWGDSWDDEEAPKTPSLPITPSLSSKGLASRKLSKDAWKD